MRRSATWGLVAAITLGSAVGLGYPTSATAQTPLNTLSYVGTLDSSFKQSSGTDTTHLEWDLEGSQPIDSNVMTWKFTKLTGTFTGIINFQSCSASLSAAANPNGVYAPGISPDTGNRWDVRVYNPGDATANSGSPTSYQVTADGGCNMTEAYALVHIAEAQAPNSACVKALAPDYLVLGNGASTTDLGCPLTTVGDASASTTIQITASLSFYGRGTGKSAPNPPPPGPSPTPGPPTTIPPAPSPTRAKEKIIALDDLVKTFPRDVAECFDSARAGVSTAVAGPLSAQAQAQLIPGFEAACATDTARLVHDWYVVNDPPDPRFGSVAVPAKAKAITLPNCAAKDGLCRSLKPLVAKLVLTARTTTAVSAAIETTVNRLSGAEAANNPAGIARQTAALKALNTKLASAAKARNKAGAALSKRLKAARITVRLSKGQQAKSLAYVLARLKKAGVNTTKFTAEPGVSTKAHPVDVLALL